MAAILACGGGARLDRGNGAAVLRARSDVVLADRSKGVLADRSDGVLADRSDGVLADRGGVVLRQNGDVVLSHRSAAALYGIGAERKLSRGRAGFVQGDERLIEVTARRRGEHHRPGIRVRSRPSLSSYDLGTFAGIPVTSPVRTFLDIATELPPNRLERAINEADKRDLIDPDSLRKGLDARPGEPGIRLLRQVLDEHTFRLSDDELELLFRPLAKAAGLPIPLTKQIVDRFEVDFYWPDLGLVVETDGWRYHRTPSAQTRDALRFQTHTAAGRTPIRFSHWQVKYDPAHVTKILTRTAARLRPRIV